MIPKPIIPELVLVESDGTRRDAKITGYNTEGKLPPAVDGEIRRNASEVGLNLYTRGVGFNNEGALEESDELVLIKEYRCTESRSGQTQIIAGRPEEVVDVKPMLDLLANVGTSKRGAKWNMFPTVSYKGHVHGAHLTSGPVRIGNKKRYFEELPVKPKAEKKPDSKPEDKKPDDKKPDLSGLTK